MQERSHQQRANMAKRFSKAIQGIQGILSNSRPEDTHSKPRRSDSSSFPDRSTIIQGETIGAPGQTPTNYQNLNPTTDNEQYMQKASQSHLYGKQPDNDGPNLVEHHETTYVEHSGLIGQKEEVETRTISTNSAASEMIDEHTVTQIKLNPGRVVNATYNEPQEHLSPQAVFDLSADCSNLLWDEAYDEIKQEYPDMVMWYEQILSTRLERIGEESTRSSRSSASDPFAVRIHQGDHRTRRAQMDELLNSWLGEVDDEEESEDDDDEDSKEDGVGIITLRGILRKVVEATRPDAVLAWVGICFASRILLAPKPSNEEDCIGLIHVISRMDWYRRLSLLLSQGTDADSAQGQLRKRIIDLYKAILSYEMNVLCSHRGTLAFSFPAGIYRPRDSKAISLETIRSAEEALPIFNEKIVNRPLFERMSLSAKRTAILRMNDDYEESNESLDPIKEMLLDLHVDDALPTILGAEDDQTMRDLYNSLSEKHEYTEIRSWDQKDSGLLWIRGSAGQGKTMLMKSIIRALSGLSPNDSKEQSFSFFLFDSCGPRANNAAAALKHLIKGIIAHQQSLAKYLEDKRNATGRTVFDDPNDFLALSKILRDIIHDQDFPETYLVVDALDECSSGGQRPDLIDFAQFIRDSVRTSARVRWIVSSDLSDTLQSVFGQMNKCATIDISSLTQSKAIHNYIKTKVEVLAGVKGYDEGLKKIIMEALCEQASNNYLHVNIICDVLKSEEQWYVETVLNEVKDVGDLDSLYRYCNSKLRDLPRDDGAFCFKVLGTLAVVDRPLKISDLQGIVRLRPRVDLRSIIKKCNCFLNVSDDDTVLFTHHSAKKYMRNQVVSISHTYQSLIQLSIDSLVRVLARDTLEEYSTLGDITFLGWIYYLNCIITDNAVADKIDQSPKLDPEVIEKVSSFLRGYLIVWVETLRLKGLLAKATAMLRQADLLLTVTTEELNELSAAIRDAHLIINFHVSMESPKHISINNTMLFCPTEGIAKIKYFKDESRQVKVLQAENRIWRRDFGSLKGHTDWTRSVAFSPDCRLLASGSDDSSVRIWDTETWTTQHTLEIEKGWIYSVSFSAKGHIAAGSDEGSIIIWDSCLGLELYKLEGHIGKLRSLAFSPDTRYLAAAGLRSLRIWDLDSQPRTSRDINLQDVYVMSVSFSWDGKLLASGADDGKIRIWDSWRDASFDESPLILSGHTGEINSVVFSPKTRPGYLASASSDGTTRMWALEGGQARCVLTLNSSEPVNSISLSPNGLQLAAAINFNTIEIWDVDIGVKLETMRATNKSDILSVTFSPTGAYIASGSRDGGVYLWYTANKETTQKPCPQPPTINEPIVEVTVAPDGQAIAAGHENGLVTLWDMNDGSALPTKLPLSHSRMIYCLAFSPNGLYLASSSSDCTVQIYNITKKERVQKLDDHDDYVRSVAWSPKGKYLASGSDNKTVCIYQMDNQAEVWGKVQTVIHGETYGNYVRAVAFSSNEAELYLAAGGDNGKVVVWKKAWNEWVSYYTIDAHSDWVRSVVFTPDDKRIVSAADDLNIRVWDLERKDFVGEPIDTAVIHTRMRFEKGWETSGYVMTSVGAQSIDPSTEALLPDWCPNAYEEVRGKDGIESWITRCGRRTVFLPKPFRPTTKYFLGNKVVIGMGTGSVMVLHFPEKEPSRVS